MRSLARLVTCAALVAGCSTPLAAAVKPGLEGAQDLFRRNHWAEARAHLGSQWASLPQANQGAARFLIGRSHAREAEFYAAARRFGADVGLVYLKELAAQRGNRAVPFVPLFSALYELEAGELRAAERALLAAAALPGLPPEWKTTARLRRAVALHRLGRAGEAASALAPAGAEARFCRLVLGAAVDAAGLNPSTRRDRVFAAAVLFRGSDSAAEPLLAKFDPDLPDAESRSDARKVLRFFDPAVALAWERIAWERALGALSPLALGGSGAEKALAAHYAGLSLFELGACKEAAPLLKEASASAASEQLGPTARLLLAACSWTGRAPTAAELVPLWEATQGQTETVLVWEELRRPALEKLEPFATRLDARLRALPSSGRLSGAVAGRWALARLWRGDDPGALVATLAEYRDDSNKNKIEWNDPLLLLALAAANYRHQQYAQSLEALFELGKSFPGLRGLQWNLQGLYAARQKSGGEARISQ